ncbi:MAG TPA: DUF4349 domain-containing protein [Ktedonobacteraceae bacterium]|nr:DUF4349 domain-containing protein [Ktedonobacteraceae bacterium]
MRDLFEKNFLKSNRKRITLQGSLGILFILALLLAACGAGTSTAAGTSYSMPASANAPVQHSDSSSSQGSTTSSGQKSNSSASYGPQYLIKSLQVNMQVKDTRQVASDLQAWISTTDPGSSSAGIDYEQAGDNLYTVSMTFSVESRQYTQIEEYLAGYAQQHGGNLLSLHESVQDVTNDYIDTQSQLTNLRGEQERLLVLLSNTTALGDIITVEDKLTNVEGQIEDIEAHLNALKSQTTYYTVTIYLQPLALAAPPPPQQAPWSIGQVFHDSWSAVLSFGQVLATFLIWLLSISIYLVPAALIVWFIWRRTHPRRVMASPRDPSQLGL